MVGSRYDAPHCDYSDKGKAIRALTGDNRFTKDIDYKVFTQNGKNPTEGRSTIVYTMPSGGVVKNNLITILVHS